MNKSLLLESGMCQRKRGIGVAPSEATTHTRFGLNAFCPTQPLASVVSKVLAQLKLPCRLRGVVWCVVLELILCDLC
jgi:hypothetical protein